MTEFVASDFTFGNDADNVSINGCAIISVTLIHVQSPHVPWVIGYININLAGQVFRI